MTIPGFGERKANNILKKMTGISLTEAQVLKCAMINGISESNAQKLIDHFGGILKFINSFGYDFTKIDGIGDIMSKTITYNMHRFNDMYVMLRDYIEIESIQSEVNKDYKPNVVFTGKCEQFTRKEMNEILIDNGYNPQKGITKSTDLLLVADENSTSSKMKKAEKLGIEVKTYDRFLVEI